jgi:hypothetical protein
LFVATSGSRCCMVLSDSAAARIAGILAILLTALLLGPASAQAAKPQPQQQPFSLTSEYVQNSPNPSAPTWCLNEDDFHQRAWSGYLSGTFSATEQLCSYSLDFSGGTYWSAGGIGLQADLYAVGVLNGFSITSPQGVTRAGVLVGSEYLNKQHTIVQSHYQVCFVPPYSKSTDIGGTPLPGGTWTFTLAGDFSQATYKVNAQMTDVNFQLQNCPIPEQNLTP